MIKDNKITKISLSGTEYTLNYDGLYFWSREGSLPKMLEGKYSSHVEAQSAFNRYNSTLMEETSEVNGEEELDSLSKKVDLLQWAEKRHIDVPAKLLQPAAIKKFLLGQANA